MISYYGNYYLSLSKYGTSWEFYLSDSNKKQKMIGKLSMTTIYSYCFCLKKVVWHATTSTSNGNFFPPTSTKSNIQKRDFSCARITGRLYNDGALLIRVSSIYTAPSDR